MEPAYRVSDDIYAPRTYFPVPTLEMVEVNAFALQAGKGHGFDMRQDVDEIGNTPNDNRVTLESESRVEGPAPHVFVYDKDGNRYRVQVPSGKTAQQIAEDLVSGRESDR